MREFSSLDAYLAEKGNEIGVSDWVLLDQKRINDFAEATGDHQWIHIDPERCQKELGRTTIAHGFLTLSLLPQLSGSIFRINGLTHAINYGTNKVRFTNMVPVDSKVRLRTTLKTSEDKAGGVMCSSEAVMEIEGTERPAMVAESITVYYQ